MHVVESSSDDDSRHIALCRCRVVDVRLDGCPADEAHHLARVLRARASAMTCASSTAAAGSGRRASRASGPSRPSDRSARRGDAGRRAARAADARASACSRAIRWTPSCATRRCSARPRSCRCRPRTSPCPTRARKVDGRARALAARGGRIRQAMRPRRRAGDRRRVAVRGRARGLGAEARSSCASSRHWPRRTARRADGADGRPRRVVLVGPEGGWSAEEVEQARTAARIADARAAHAARRDWRRRRGLTALWTAWGW